MAVQNENKEFRNTFNNHSGPKGYVSGTGKFSERQTEERIRVHALAIATGNPTIQQIVETWKERFLIDITVQSEKEWRRGNRNVIEKKKHELIEKGEIEVPVVSEAILADSLMDNTIQTAWLTRDLRKKVTGLLRKIEIEPKDDAAEKERAKNIVAFTKLASTLSDLNKDVTGQLESLFSFSGRIKVKEKKISGMVDKAFEDRKRKNEEERSEEETVTPVAQITDEMRENLLKEPD
jgi:hypothetical protein